MDELPRLSLLGYQATRPRLRLLELPQETVEPSPVALNRPVAIDRGFARDGWLVLMPGTEVWGVPVPLADKAFRVGAWWSCVPAPNPRTVWLAHPVDVDSRVAIEYDGVARSELTRVELPDQLQLVAAVAEGLILRPSELDGDHSRDVLSLLPWAGAPEPLAPGSDVLAVHGSRLAVSRRSGELAFVDAAQRSELPIANPLPGRWNHNGSFSPDGRWFATAVSETDRLAGLAAALPDDFTLPDTAEGFATWNEQAPAALEFLEQPAWTRLALIDTATGEVSLAEGHFDNFASAPVWSADSRWLVFDAPFDKSLFACDVEAMRLLPVLRRRGRPSPLIDVTALVGAAPARHPA